MFIVNLLGQTFVVTVTVGIIKEFITVSITVNKDIIILDNIIQEVSVVDITVLYTNVVTVYTH